MSIIDELYKYKDCTDKFSYTILTHSYNNDEFVEKTIDAILKSAATDQVGDGKIFISPVEQAYRIRTGEKGGKSLN